MFHPLRTKISFFALLLLISISAAAQAPTDNPYRTRYGSELPGGHWTDSLPWQRVFNIQDFASQVIQVDDSITNHTIDKKISWLPAFYAAQAAAVAAGGGTIYFPVLPERIQGGFDGEDSSYYFHDDLKVKSNILLRGVTPTQFDAKQANFVPPTLFEFPRYNYGRRASGVSNNTAFKVITIDTTGVSGRGKPGVRNIAFVYLDINRARIQAHPSFRSVNVGGQSTFWANENNRNYLFLGVKSSNATLPDPNVPVRTGAQSGNQRWSWRFAANIDILVKENCIIAGCRINDQNANPTPTRSVANENFAQSNYLFTNSPCNITNANQTKFDYASHYGIALNRIKYKDYRDATPLYGFLNNATPDQEPSFYAKGNVIRDSWIYHTSRAGILAACLGLMVKNNEIHDQANKEVYVSPTGNTCQLNPTSGENEGIDFCGWNITIQDNLIEFYRAKYPLAGNGQFSIDGQAFYGQGPSGSTFRDLLIRRNRIITDGQGLCGALNGGQGKGASGINNTNYAENVRIDSNEMANTPIICLASQNGQGIMSNITISSNTNVRGITISGISGGATCRIYNNNPAPATPPLACVPNNGNNIARTCQVCLNPDSSQCDINTNTGFTIQGTQTCSSTTICGQDVSINFPYASISAPARGQTYSMPGNGILPPITLSASAGLPCNCCSLDSVIFFVDGIRIGVGTSSGPNAYESSYSFPGPGTYNISAVVYKTSDQGTIVFTRATSIVQIVITGLKSRSGFEGNMDIYPNPAGNVLNVSVGSPTLGKAHVRIVDMVGRQVMLVPFTKTGFKTNQSISLTALPKGSYRVEVSDASGTIMQKLVIE